MISSRSAQLIIVFNHVHFYYLSFLFMLVSYYPPNICIFFSIPQFRVSNRIRPI